jgi:glycerol-3-phosphate O-acyltransferase / dihydroxyacetone phosphate acyltransferase
MFYRRSEVDGLENLPPDGPVILCANHVNALVDAVVVQAASPRPLHPIARSGLFRNPLLRPILALIQAVPISRKPKDPQLQVGSNEASFERCFEYLADSRVILIFPEGQSHSDPSLRPLKTGAARLALGHRDRHGQTPTILPVGLTFTRKGRFRAGVLVEWGAPIAVANLEGDREQQVKDLTEAIEEGLKKVTINAESWADVALLDLMQRFFTLRRGHARTPLAERFGSLRRLIATHRLLRANWPEQVEELRNKMQRFERLQKRFGVRDYQLNLRYTPGVIARFLARCAFFAVLVLPLALWGLINSALPYLLTQVLARWAARGRDQLDTAGLLIGIPLIGLCWSAQSFAVWHFWGERAAMFYALSLPLTAGIALKVNRERFRIFEEIRVYGIFARRRDLQTYLREKRAELEVELARLAKLARQLKTPMVATTEIPEREINS